MNGALDMDRLFGDQLVTATELNRRVGAVLNMALEQPATIIRNNQYFALLPREFVAQLSALHCSGQRSTGTGIWDRSGADRAYSAVR